MSPVAELARLFEKVREEKSPAIVSMTFETEVNGTKYKVKISLDDYVEEEKAMKASTFAKLQNLLHIGLKGRDKDTLRDIDNAYYLDPGHVTYIRVRGDTSMPVFWYLGAKEEEFNLPVAFRIDSRVVIKRTYLLDVLKNLDSEKITLECSTDYPLIVSGKVEDTEVDAWIAPRVGSD